MSFDFKGDAMSVAGSSTGLYCSYDKVSKRLSHFMIADNPSMYIREMVAHRVAFPLNFDDLVPVRVSDLEQFLDLDGFEILDWSQWRSPQTQAELLAPLNLSLDEQAEISQNIIKKSAQSDK